MWCEHITDHFSYTYKRKGLNDEDSSERHDGVSLKASKRKYKCRPVLRNMKDDTEGKRLKK